MNTFNESFERIDNAIEKILQTVERIKNRKTMTHTQISNATMNAILNDINEGKFSNTDAVNYHFYNDKEKGYLIGVTSRIDIDFYPTDLDVDIVDCNGNELWLDSDQINQLEHALDKDLIYRKEEAESEAKYRKYLNNTMYA